MVNLCSLFLLDFPSSRGTHFSLPRHTRIFIPNSISLSFESWNLSWFHHLYLIHEFPTRNQCSHSLSLSLQPFLVIVPTPCGFFPFNRNPSLLIYPTLSSSFTFVSSSTSTHTQTHSHTSHLNPTRLGMWLNGKSQRWPIALWRTLLEDSLLLAQLTTCIAAGWETRAMCGSRPHQLFFQHVTWAKCFCRAIAHSHFCDHDAKKFLALHTRQIDPDFFPRDLKMKRFFLPFSSVRHNFFFSTQRSRNSILGIDQR